MIVVSRQKIVSFRPSLPVAGVLLCSHFCNLKKSKRNNENNIYRSGDVADGHPPQQQLPYAAQVNKQKNENGTKNGSLNCICFLQSPVGAMAYSSTSITCKK